MDFPDLMSNNRAHPLVFLLSLTLEPLIKPLLFYVGSNSLKNVCINRGMCVFFLSAFPGKQLYPCQLSRCVRQRLDGNKRCNPRGEERSLSCRWEHWGPWITWIKQNRLNSTTGTHKHRADFYYDFFMYLVVSVMSTLGMATAIMTNSRWSMISITIQG